MVESSARFPGKAGVYVDIYIIMADRSLRHVDMIKMSDNGQFISHCFPVKLLERQGLDELLQLLDKTFTNGCINYLQPFSLNCNPCAHKSPTNSRSLKPKAKRW